jgi:iron complex outermembrane receptor protein
MSSECKRSQRNAGAHARILIIEIAMLAGFVVTAPVYADDSDQLQEIVVTAQKRAQDIKDVPVSISDLSGADLKEAHIADYDDLTRSVPSVSFAAGGSGNGVGEGLSTIAMRGISSTVGSAVVGVYLDDVPITVKNTYDGMSQPIPLDISRVEVLRGPQGTLYGASSAAGTIRFITNQPSFAGPSLEVATDLSQTERGGFNYDVSAVGNYVVAPDSVALRMAADFGYDPGWINHYNPPGSADPGALDGKGVNTEWHGVIKLAALIHASDAVSITPSVWLQRVRSDDSPVFYPDLGVFNQAKYVPEPSNDRLIIPSLTVDADLGFSDFTSVSSYFDRQEVRTTDGTYFNDYSFAVNYLDLTPPFSANAAQNDSIIANIPSPVQWNTRYRNYSQELRLSSRDNDVTPSRLKWTAGLFMSYQTITHLNSEYSPGLNSDFESIYGYPLSSPIVQNALGSTATTFDNDLIFQQANVERIGQYSAFGQVDYDILRSLHGSVGIRYETASSSNAVETSGYYGIGIPTPFYATGRYISTTPKFSVVYDLTDSSTAYMTAAKGYRLGAGNTPDPEGPGNLCTLDYSILGVSGAPLTYKSDYLWNYELGTKLTVADRTLSIRAAVYLINWYDIQQTFVLPHCGFNYTGNFGDARSYGSELEVEYKAPFVRSLTLGASANTAHSTLTSTNAATVVQVGEHILYIPNYTYSLHADYRRSLAAGWRAFSHADFTYTGQSYGSYQAANSNYIDPGYSVLNLSIGLESDSALQMSLYAKNLTDDRTIIQQPQVNGLIEGYAVRPLTIGIAIDKKF